MRDVFELIGKLQKDLPIDPDRVYVTGQSMGGYGTFQALVERPKLFAAGAPVCGGNNPANAGKISAVPIWIFHGAKDTAGPVRNVAFFSGGSHRFDSRNAHRWCDVLRNWD